MKKPLKRKKRTPGLLARGKGAARRKPLKNLISSGSKRRKTKKVKAGGRALAGDTVGQQPFGIAGVSASAGAFEAIRQLFYNMPGASGVGFVLVMHQHPGHLSLLTALLGKKTILPVIEAADQMGIEPDRIHVCPSRAHLAILNGRIQLMPVSSQPVTYLPIDYFFRCLAQDQRERAIGIVLSGTGTDGALGLKAIKAEGGMTLAQKVETAKYAGMPSSAIATGFVNCVVPPKEMLRQSQDARTVQDFEGRITAWNQGAEVMYGWSEAEALQMNVRLIVPKDKLSEMDSFLERLRSGEQIPAFETQRVRKDGRTVDVWLTVSSLLDDAGEPVAIATNEPDLSELKRKLRQLQ